MTDSEMKLCQTKSMKILTGKYPVNLAKWKSLVALIKIKFQRRTTLKSRFQLVGE